MADRVRLYTTVTLADFDDSVFIEQLKTLEIGFELALTTPLATRPNRAQYAHDLAAAQAEAAKFKRCFERVGIAVGNVRLHQPGGYAYDWSGEGLTGFDFLKVFFAYCFELGFVRYVIHAPYGNVGISAEKELADYRAKLNTLTSATVEVEEIVASCSDDVTQRCYCGTLFEQLMRGQRATALLDTYECGGVEQTVQRMAQLKTRRLMVTTIHVHKNKHQLLVPIEVGALLQSSFAGSLVNEGFIKDTAHFDEFIKTKSLECVVPHAERIEMLKAYLDLL